MSSLQSQRVKLPFKAVLLHLLDADQRTLKTASGFIRREGEELYLYTCWHVVTGYDPNKLVVTNELPNRVFIDVQLQDAKFINSQVTVIGGQQCFRLSLYDRMQFPRSPSWLQDDRHRPHPDLNAINIFVPSWHDTVKIALPREVKIAETQIVDERICPGDASLTVGDKLYVVGFPYGYSSFGRAQPTAIVLTRFLASTGIDGRKREFLLDSPGAPSMSGGPVFIESDRGLEIFGIYNGSIYPDYMMKQNDKTTALGTCSSLQMHWWGHLPFVLTPSQVEEVPAAFHYNTDSARQI